MRAEVPETHALDHGRRELRGAAAASVPAPIRNSIDRTIADHHPIESCRAYRFRPPQAIVCSGLSQPTFGACRAVRVDVGFCGVLPPSGSSHLPSRGRHRTSTTSWDSNRAPGVRGADDLAAVAGEEGSVARDEGSHTQVRNPLPSGLNGARTRCPVLRASTEFAFRSRHPSEYSLQSLATGGTA